MIEFLQHVVAIWVLATLGIYFVSFMWGDHDGEWYEYVFGPPIIGAILVAVILLVVGAMWLGSWALRVLAS
jgi:hypothetical protein